MKHPFAMRSGDRVAVIRPDDPELALRLTREVHAAGQKEGVSPEELERRFQGILSAQNYTYVGLLSGGSRPRVLDGHGWAIGQIRAGDSFVPFEQIRMAAVETAHAGARAAEAPADAPGVRVDLVVQEDGSLDPRASGGETDR